MVTKEEVEKLSELARISIKKEESDSFIKDFGAILDYVGELNSLTLPSELSDVKMSLHNVFREDKDPTPSGTWTKKITDAFPEKEGNALVVKQIISHD